VPAASCITPCVSLLLVPGDVVFAELECLLFIFRPFGCQQPAASLPVAAGSSEDRTQEHLLQKKKNITGHVNIHYWNMCIPASRNGTAVVQ